MRLKRAEPGEPSCNPTVAPHIVLAVVGSASRLEQFDRIPVRIHDLDLATTRTCLHLVAKGDVSALEFGDARGEIDHPQHHTVPPTWRLMFAIRIGHDPDAPGPLRRISTSPNECDDVCRSMMSALLA